MAEFSFLWPSNIPLCECTHTHSWPLNNMGLTAQVHLYADFFPISTWNTTWSKVGSWTNLNLRGVSVQFSSVQFSCSVVSNSLQPHEPPGLPVHHQLPEFTQTYVYWVGNAIQPSHPLSSPSPSTFNLSRCQGIFKWVNSSHEVPKVLEFQLQLQSFQWTPRTDLL